MFYYFDPTYIILIPGLIFTIYAQMRINSAYGKYKQVYNASGRTGADTARRILDSNGLNDVKVEMASGGNLSDHYDPRTKTVKLSKEVYSNASVASIAIAAHECGHAIQHATAYGPLKFRTAIVPVVSLASYASWILIILGIIMSEFGLVQIGIICFGATVLFQLITLPVEYDASRRALVQLEGLGITDAADQTGVKKVLNAAAMTYVAALLVSILQLVRLLAIFGRRRD